MDAVGRVQGQALGFQIPNAQGKYGQKGGAAQIKVAGSYQLQSSSGSVESREARAICLLFSSFLAKGDQSKSALPSSSFLSFSFPSLPSSNPEN